MEPKTNYAVVGMFVLVLTSSLVFVSLWLSSGLDSYSYADYAIYLNESVSGLSEQSTVKFNGVAVGRVKSIDINHKDPQQVRVTVEIRHGIPITTSTVATLKSQGITGLTYIGLTADKGKGLLLKRLPGEHYPVIRYKPSFLFQLDKSAKEVSDSVKGVAQNLKDVLNKQNTEALQHTLINIDKVVGALAKQSANFQKIIENSNELLVNASKASKQLPDVMMHVDRMSQQVSQAGYEVSQTMRVGRRALSVIERQALPPAISLFSKLDKLASRVDAIARELERNPSMLVRGKAQRRLGPGEH